MTSSSAWLSRFFFFRPGCSAVPEAEAPLLVRPLEWVCSPVAEDEASPFCEEEEGEAGAAVSGVSCGPAPPAPAPLACMFPPLAPLPPGVTD
ncbi:hypothetical protein GDO81_022032 [Engystomops pustulosus]|uniref:Secreted protein n=1 Tax=Engystomops pustulosus TaxID=76066 RepID=A0AAV6YUJ9_ENGPU|nr:hypothetical protein GDO81_022032 [Engystomops pustulosus]